MKQLVTIFIVAFCCLSLQGQVRVTALFDSTKMLIGDQTDFHLIATVNPGTGVVFPILEKQLFDGMEIIQLGDIDTVNRTPKLVLQQDITVAAYDSGFYKIPPLPFAVKRGNRIIDTNYTKMVMMTVHTLAVDTNYLAPIKPNLHQPLTFQEILPYIIGILGFCMLVFGLYSFKKRSENVVIEQPEIVIPAHEIAFDKLRALKDKKLWQQGNLKEYHSQLTFTVREYIENRFEVPALESTTDEILTALKQKDIESQQKNLLREVLQAADLVKFAKSAPPPEVHEKAMDVATDFVKTTKKEIVLTEPTEPEGNV